jgi:glycerol-3-phosphate acyltransferase PlsY
MDWGAIGYGGLFLLAAYLAGSIPFGFLLAKACGLGDIRAIGSGNIGATNVLRAGNKKIAALTLLLDALKGALAIIVLMGGPPTMMPTSFVFNKEAYVSIGVLLGLAAILGHCFPVWLKFKGGKGVATALGVLLTAVPLAGLVAITTWGIVAGFFRYSSLAALSAVAIAPLVTLIIYGDVPAALALSIAVLVILRHKANIQRLIAGEEPKIGAPKPKQQEPSDEPAKPSE